MKTKIQTEKNHSFSSGEQVNYYNSCGVIEGFAGFEPTLVDQLEAWSYLIKTGHCWHLQGFYGRQANDLLEMGVITPEGQINWDAVEECFEMI